MTIDPTRSTTPEHFAGGYFRDPAAVQGTEQLSRGLIGHVPIVALLMIVLGTIELAFSGFTLLCALISTILPAETGANGQVLAVMYGGLTVLAAGCGTLRIAAGIFNLRFRRRKLGMAAHLIGLTGVLTGFCAPTAIGLAIYGLIVYWNDSVIAAFEMGDRGRSAADIQRAFGPG